MIKSVKSIKLEVEENIIKISQNSVKIFNFDATKIKDFLHARIQVFDGSKNRKFLEEIIMVNKKYAAIAVITVFVIIGMVAINFLLSGATPITSNNTKCLKHNTPECPEANSSMHNTSNNMSNMHNMSK